MAQASEAAVKLDVKEQLIRGALKMIAEEGPTDVSVRRLAESASRTTMCIYTKFGNRRGLLAATYERAAGSLLDRLDACAQDGFDAVVDAYRAAADEAPGVYTMLFEQPLDGLELDPAWRAGLLEQVTERLAQQIPQVTRQASANMSTAMTVWATMHGLIAHRFAAPGVETHEAWCRRYNLAVRAIASVAE